MRLGISLLFVFFSFSAMAVKRPISDIEFHSEMGVPLSITTTTFKPGEEEEFSRLVRDVEGSVEETFVVQNTSRPGKWFNVFEKENEIRRTLFKSRHESEDFDKVGAFVAIFRTAYSSVFWIVISDFNILQAAAMTTMQAVLHYSFTYQGYGLNILEASKLIAGNVAESVGFEKAKKSKSFNNSVKYLTNFNMSTFIGAGFVAILSWENFPKDFSQVSTYAEIVYYSLMGMFASGGWNSFLSEQKFATHPVISQKTVHRVFQTNGVLMAIAFPLMMNGYVSGHVVLASLGVSGVVAAFLGHEIVQDRKSKKQKVLCSMAFQ